MSDSPLVHLASAGNNVEASILRSYLEDHGIHCYVQGENHRFLIGGVAGGAFIELNLMVPEADLDRARLLLQEFENASSASDDTDEDENAAPDDKDGAPEDAQAQDEARERHRHKARMRLRGARIFGLLLPVGIVHLLMGAHARGVLLLAACLGAWYMALTRSTLLWVVVALMVVAFDMKAAGMYVDEQVDRQ